MEADQPAEGGGENFYPSYSPDGKKIVYMHDGANDRELYTIDVRTGTRSSSPTTIGKTSTLPIRPTARKMFYSGSTGPGDTEIYTINASGEE